MTDVTIARENIQIEEVQYRSSVSEAVGTKLGGSINFINERQYDSHTFNLNGPYKLGEGSTGTDGIFPILYNMEIIAYTVFNLTPGSSGVTNVDVHWLSGGGTDNGSIFSSAPSINTTAAANAYAIKDVKGDIGDKTAGGIALGTISKTTFDAGQALRFDLDAGMIGAENCGLIVHFRPRD